MRGCIVGKGTAEENIGFGLAILDLGSILLSLIG